MRSNSWRSSFVCVKDQRAPDIRIISSTALLVVFLLFLFMSTKPLNCSDSYRLTWNVSFSLSLREIKLFFFIVLILGKVVVLRGFVKVKECVVRSEWCVVEGKLKFEVWSTVRHFFVELRASVFGWTSNMLKSSLEMLAHPSMWEIAQRKGFERGGPLQKKKPWKVIRSVIFTASLFDFCSWLDTVQGFWPAAVHHGV